MKKIGNEASIFEKMERITKYSIKLEDAEQEIRKLLKADRNLKNAVSLANFKRYFYKHILEIEKGQ